MNKWKHDDLLLDLAEHLERPERMLWRDMPMGPSGSQRPDVWTLNKSYTNPKPVAYEIKVSTSDYRADITAAKWQGYLEYSAGVCFCVPKGLITKADLPQGAGLMVRSETGWRTIKAPTLHPVTVPQKLLLKLLIDGLPRILEDRRIKEVSTYHVNKKIKKEHGDLVAKTISDIESAQRGAEYAQERVNKAYEEARQILSDAKEKARDERDKFNSDLLSIRHELADILGLSPNANIYEIRRRASHLRQEISTDYHIQRLTNALGSIQHQLDNELSKLMPPDLLARDAK